MFILKDNVPEFTAVEGRFANLTFRRGEAYAEVPPGEEEKFMVFDGPSGEDDARE